MASHVISWVPNMEGVFRWPDMTSISIMNLVGVLWWPEAWLALACLYLINVYRRQRNENIIDWPLVGMLPSSILHLHELYEWTTKGLSENGGTTFFKGPWFTGMDMIATSDPRNIEYMLKTNFANFPKGEDFNEIFHELMGQGIFNADDISWKAQRKIANTLVHSKTFRVFVARTSEDMVRNQLVPLLDHAARLGSIIDLQDIFLRFTFDSTCTAVFGSNPGCLSPTLPTVPFAKAIDDAMESVLYRHVLPEAWWHLLRRLNIGKERQFTKAMKIVEDFVAKEVSKKSLAIGQGNRGEDLLSSYMSNTIQDHHQAESNHDQYMSFLRDTCVNFLIAGRDTSGVALTWFFWLLHNNPRVENRILEELGQIVKEKGLSDPSKVIFTSDDLQKMDYLQAALCESLRLYPSVPIGHKGVLKEDVLPNGTVVKPGMKILYIIYSIGRMEWVWGKDCLEYIPERWLDEDGKLKKQQISEFRFLAFNGGPRTCVGKDMAFVQMKHAVSQIILNYKIEVVEGHPVSPKPSVIMSMKNGLKVRVMARAPKSV